MEFVKRLPSVCIRKREMNAYADIINPRTHNKYSLHFRKKYILGDDNNKRKTFNDLLDKVSNRLTNEQAIALYTRIDGDVIICANKIHLSIHRK